MIKRLLIKAIVLLYHFILIIGIIIFSPLIVIFTLFKTRKKYEKR